MNVGHPIDLDRRAARDLPPDVDAIHSPAAPPPEPHLSRAMLRPEQDALSLPPPDPPPSPIAPLTRFLGPALTVANPAWCEDALPRLRALQKKLVEHALKLPEDDRAECMAALSVVESDVQLRLRLQQMRMNEFEREIRIEKGKAA